MKRTVFLWIDSIFWSRTFSECLKFTRHNIQVLLTTHLQADKFTYVRPSWWRYVSWAKVCILSHIFPVKYDWLLVNPDVSVSLSLTFTFIESPECFDLKQFSCLHINYPLKTVCVCASFSMFNLSTAKECMCSLSF